MGIDIIASPHRRSSSFKKQFHRDELGSFSTVIRRHKYLLTALVLLTFLCTIYLYFAVTLGANESDDTMCSGLSGTELSLCRLEYAKTSMGKGKMKFF